MVGVQLIQSASADERQEVPILMYHYVREVDSNTDPLGYGLSVSPEIFASHLAALEQAGYTTITPQQFLSGDYPDKSLILSFDDGYDDFYSQARPLLLEHQMTAIAFVIYGFLDQENYLSTGQVEELVADGFEIGSHTVSHPNLTSLDDTRLQQELMESRTALERLTGKRIIAISYPSGEYDERVLRYANFVGYKFGVTVENGLVGSKNELLKLPRVRVGGNESANDLLAEIENLRSSWVA